MWRRIYIVTILVLCIINLKAQQQPVFNASLLNPYLENSSLAGNNNYASGYLHYKKQWVEIEGAPESAVLSIDWPLNNEKSGLGVMVSSDRANILGHVGLTTSYSHGINITGDQKLRLGLGIKLNHNTIYFDKVNAEQEYESALFNYFESATGFNSNFGMHYSFKELNVGFSGTNLLNSKIQYSDATNDKKLYFQYVPQFLFNVNYTYAINDEVWIRPDVAIRTIQGMPVQPEVSVFSLYQEKYGAGVVYRNKNSFSLIFSALVYNRFNVAYSYQASLGEMAGYGGATHEITFGYRFYTSHYQEYKPVDNQKVDELLDFAQKQVDQNKELKKDNERLKNEQQQIRKELEKDKDEIARLKELLLEQQGSYNRAKEEDETEIDDIAEELFKHPDEPIYIILGVFKDIHTAQKYQQVLSRETGISTEMLKRKNNQDYIVCVNRKFETKGDLKKELSRLHRMTKEYNNSDPWIYVNQ